MGTQKHPLEVSVDVAVAALEDFHDIYERRLQNGRVYLTSEPTQSKMVKFVVAEKPDGVLQKALIQFRPTPNNECTMKIEPCKHDSFITYIDPNPPPKELQYYPLCEPFIAGLREYLDELGYLADEEGHPTAAD